MNPGKNIETQLEQLAQAIPSGNSFVDGVMSRIETSSDKLQKQSIHINFVRRLFMKTTVKFAAAAIVLIAALLSLTLFDKTVTPAYALEQTIQACHSVRTIHLREYHPNQETPIMIWAEFSPDGKTRQMRLSIPEWDNPAEGAKEVVWKDNIAQVWLKKKNLLVTMRETSLAEKILHGMEKADPKLLVQNLEELRQRNEAQIQIEQPKDKSMPIQVVATLTGKDPLLGDRLVVEVDQATKLVLSLRLFSKLSETNYEEIVYFEFQNYNQPFDETIFALDVPKDVTCVDQ